MSSAVKLMLSFAVSVALHAAGLWAAAGSLEPRQAEASVEVAIVDRDLFFRHASRADILAPESLSATERLAPEAGSVVRPRNAGASLDPAPAAAATEPEAERRSAVKAASDAAANPDLSTVEATPSPRPEAIAPEDDYAQASEPERMSGVAAEPSLAASPPRVQPSTRVAQAAAQTPERTPSAELAAEAAIASPQPLQPAEDSAQASRAPAAAPAQASAGQPLALEPAPPLSSSSPAETLERTAAEAPERRTVDVIPNAEAAPPPVLPLEQGLAGSAPRMASTESAPLERSVAPSSAAEAARPAETVPPPLIAQSELQVAEAFSPPAQTLSTGDGSRLQADQAAEPARGRASVAGVPRRAAQPVARIPARAPVPTPFRPSVPDPASNAGAAPTDLAALPPGSLPDEPFTTAHKGGECFFPLQVASQDGAIQGYGVDAESLRMFRQSLAQKLGREPDVVWRPLTDAQCGGISFTRLILGEAAPSVHIGLQRKELALGEPLSGRVTGSHLDFVTLLIVDDGGLVHNVLRYLRTGTAGLEFSVPVQPVDQGVDRVQLIMAVGASKPLAVLKWTTAVHSDDFFPELVRQAVETGASLELGLADFVILDGPR